MATKAKIEITFTRNVLDLEEVLFFRTSDATLTALPLLSTFVSGARTKNGEIPIESPTATPGEVEASTYEKYFHIDHNAAGLMTITRLVNVVTIEIDLNWIMGTFSTTTGATDVLTARVPDLFQLTNASLQVHPTEPCDIVDVEILTTQQATGYSYGGSTDAIILVSTNPFTVPIDRTITREIIIIKTGRPPISVNEVQFNEPHFYFRKIFPETGINVLVQPNPLTGSTITINVSYGSQLQQRPVDVTLTYSLDGFTFQSSNIYTGQVDGDYTIYVKDGLGCTVTKDFTIAEGSSGRDAFFKVYPINSVSFSQDEVWDGLQGGIHKNQGNVLALTDFKKNLYDEKLIFREEDEIRIQFKSNYDFNNITIENCEGDEIGYTPSVDKMTNNLNLFESLDAKLYSIAQNVSGLYFTEGKTYDEADQELGEFELNGNLPDSAIVGTLVEIIGYGQHLITDIVFDSAKDKKVMVFDFDFSSNSAINVRMKAYYDLLPFEVYEFNVAFDLVIIHGGLPKEIRIRIMSTDDLYDELNHYSEFIAIHDTYEDGFKKYVAINYSNNNNRDVFYLYGITHFIRAEILMINSLIDDDSEIIKGDLTTYYSESTVHEGISISFSETTYRVMLKIVLALSSENLFINGLGYVKRDNVSVTPVDNTNLYLITCELISSNKNFNNFIDSNTGNKEDFKTTFIPKLITSGSGSYIKI